MIRHLLLARAFLLLLLSVTCPTTLPVAADEVKKIPPESEIDLTVSDRAMEIQRRAYVWDGHILRRRDAIQSRSEN